MQATCSRECVAGGEGALLQGARVWRESVSPCHDHSFLCKPKDDLRKDVRMMELMTAVNRLLHKSGSCRRRRLAVTCYSVVPLDQERDRTAHRDGERGRTAHRGSKSAVCWAIRSCMSWRTCSMSHRIATPHLPLHRASCLALLPRVSAGKEPPRALPHCLVRLYELLRSAGLSNGCQTCCNCEPS